jgi:chromosome segregation ATPase
MRIRKAVQASLDDLLAQLNEDEARLHTMIDADDNVMTLYHAQLAELEKLTATLARLTGKRDRLVTKMTELRERWTTQLDVLITSVSRSFSDAFESIGCCGEVRIAQHEDYDKWGIDILVKFR